MQKQDISGSINFQSFREAIGQFLDDRMKELNLSRWDIRKNTGLSKKQIEFILDGTGNYTIDSLLKMIKILDMYFYFATRDNKTDKLNETDFFNKLKKYDPEK